MKQIINTIQVNDVNVYRQKRTTRMSLSWLLNGITLIYPDWISSIPAASTLINIIFFMDRSYKICPVIPS